MPQKEVRQWNSTLPRRKTPMQRGAGLKSKGFKKSSPTTPKKRSLGAGKKTKQWEADRRKLKVVFAEAGITTCELGHNGCWRDNGRGFAHSLKRRNITTEAQREEVILACNHCHDAIEVLPPSVMFDIVRGVILRRKVAVKSIFEKIEERV